VYDVAIVGAGIVGCAVFRECVLAGLSSVLIERAADILDGASKANSAILHTGFDSKPGSLERKLIQAGHHYYRRIHHKLGLSLLETGATLVAWTEADRSQLDAIAATAVANGVPLDRLSPDDLRKREPALADRTFGGLFVRDESLIDPWSAPLAYATQGCLNGGTVLRSTNITSGIYRDGMWRLSAGQRAIHARTVINCAGLQGDIVEAIARPSPFTIRPRKGEFIVYDKRAHDLVQSIILPVPTPLTKGVVITRTAFGNLLVGPTAEPQADRERATVAQDNLRALQIAGERMIPKLAEQEITAVYAGLRPATDISDYQIEAVPEENWITVGGIRSTGLTSALGIAEYVIQLYAAHFGEVKPIVDPIWPTVPNLTQSLPRPEADRHGDVIVCHCEAVTQKEIQAALTDPVLAAGSIGGLKRRTRCMMGRCQGFYCTRRVVELAAPYLPELAHAAGPAA